MSTISVRFGRNKCADELTDNSSNLSNLSEAEERRSCWSVLSINRVVIEAKIIHTRGGKFKILDDNREGKYVGTIVDASDVIRCIV
ncbi:MAG: hypothetical protein WBZ36_16660 [Candidatus Nitrosopolaris sp.]